MKWILSGGTDGGSMALFDPDGLPEEFDEWVAQGAEADHYAALEADGRMFWVSDGDGGFDICLFVDEPLPDDVSEFAEPLEGPAILHVPSGRLQFAGLEYMYRGDDSRLRRNLSMGQAAELSPGSYRARFFRMRYPDGFHAELVRPHVSPAGRLMLAVAAPLGALGCLSGTLAFAAVFVLILRTWALCVAAPALLVLATHTVMVNLPAYKRAASTRLMAELVAWWDYAAVLTRADAVAAE